MLSFLSTGTIGVAHSELSTFLMMRFFSSLASSCSILFLIAKDGVRALHYLGTEFSFKRILTFRSVNTPDSPNAKLFWSRMSSRVLWRMLLIWMSGNQSRRSWRSQSRPSSGGPPFSTTVRIALICCCSYETDWTLSRDFDLMTCVGVELLRRWRQGCWIN